MIWLYNKKQVICENANAKALFVCQVSVNKFSRFGSAMKKILVKRLSHDKKYSLTHFTDEAESWVL